MALVSTRSQTIAGKPFKRGQPVQTELLTPEKASQLLSLRRLRDTQPKHTTYVALRAFKTYKRGDKVDVSNWQPTKLAQLLEQRHIEPVAA